jgi:predicted RNA binding protein YcfA (HicA-like mRNA interferase family)
MVRIQSVHWKEFEKFLFLVGCVFKRQKGDHMIYWKEGIKRPIVIPRDKSLPAFIIINNLRVLGVSREEYLACRNADLS